MSAAAKNIKNVKIQWRVCFGVEKPLSPNLAGMRIVEYYFTADNIVPCHLYVASRGTFSIRLLDDVKVLRIDNFDGRTRDFEFVKVDPASDSMHFLAPKPTEPTDAHMTKVDWFPLTHYNDTAFVCFDVVGNEAESAYERFKSYAGLVGPSYREQAVNTETFPPTHIWSSSFSKDVCSQKHTLQMWANSPIKTTELPDDIVKFTDADGQSISVIHYRSNDPRWGIWQCRMH